MKKNRFIRCIMSVALLLGLSQSHTHIFASDTEVETPVNVGISEGQTLPLPDPGDDVEKGKTPGTTTPFQIWKYPYPFSFESTTFSLEPQRIHADLSYYDFPYGVPLVVSDQRGTFEGWTLEATLRGGVMNATDGSGKAIRNPTINIGTANKAIYTIYFDENGVPDPWWTVEGGDIIHFMDVYITGTTSTIIAAEPGNGAGYQGVRLDGIIMDIPAGEGGKGTFMGIIDWKLVNEPY